MYLSYYGLEFNPFDKDIETKYAYETDDLRILKNRLKFVKENKENIIIIGISLIAFLAGCFAIGWIPALIIIGIADALLFVPNVIKKTNRNARH